MEELRAPGDLLARELHGRQPARCHRPAFWVIVRDDAIRVTYMESGDYLVERCHQKVLYSLPGVKLFLEIMLEAELFLEDLDDPAEIITNFGLARIYDHDGSVIPAQLCELMREVKQVRQPLPEEPCKPSSVRRAPPC